MTMLHIQDFKTTIDASRFLAGQLSDVLSDTSTPLLFLVSGGSTFEIFKNITLPENARHITLGVLDERFTQDATKNNCAQLMSYPPYQQLCARGGSVIDTRVSKEQTLEDATQQFEKSLRNWRHEHPNGKIIIFQGMGVDGHTAGIMPFPENPKRFHEMFESDSVWVQGYDAGNKNHIPLRFTTTLSFLMHEVDVSYLALFGPEKANVFQQALDAFEREGKSACIVSPISVVSMMKEVHVARCTE